VWCITLIHEDDPKKSLHFGFFANMEDAQYVLDNHPVIEAFLTDDEFEDGEVFFVNSAEVLNRTDQDELPLEIEPSGVQADTQETEVQPLPDLQGEVDSADGVEDRM